MSTFYGIVLALIGLGFLVLVHEFGHFVVAKATGMRVEEFSVGFGRFLVSRRWGETVYGISILPLGGYVRVTGMHKEEFQARVDAVRERQERREAPGSSVQDMEGRMTGASVLTDEEVIQTPPERRYYTHPLWQRSVFIVAGVTMNVLAAFVFLTIVGFQGYQEPTTTLEKVAAGSPAATAGLLTGDKIVRFGGTTVGSWIDLQQSIRSSGGKTVAIVVQRSGGTKTVEATVGTKDGSGYLGVSPAVTEVKPGLIESVRFGAARTVEFFRLTFQGIGQMISGKAPVLGPTGLSGPVGIVSASEQAVKGGFFLSLLAFISIQLAIINMIPLLPLDGGHFLFGILERVMGKTISLRTFERVSLVGIGLFLLLALVATTNDLGRLFGVAGL
jgi:regulator of sigma E protease